MALIFLPGSIINRQRWERTNAIKNSKIERGIRYQKFMLPMIVQTRLKSKSRNRYIDKRRARMAAQNRFRFKKDKLDLRQAGLSYPPFQSAAQFHEAIILAFG